MPESLRLYTLCKSVKFAALPWAGGMYDQHPQLIDEWSMIIDVERKAEERQAEQDRRRARGRTARKR